MPRERAVNVDRLLGDVQWGMRNGFGPGDLVPMLEKLVRVAPAGSVARGFAELHLAELLVARSPWRAAVLARAALAQAESDVAWSVLGLSCMVMGHYRAAERALRRARQLAPESPSYAHNLGHLLDVGLGRPRAALPHLRTALQLAPGEPELASSLAHALVGLGRVAEARALLTGTGGLDPERASQVLERWLAPAPPPTL